MAEVKLAAAAKGNGAEAPAAPAAREVAPIKRSHEAWRLREHANNEFRAFVGKDVEIKDLHDPRLWSVVASDLQPYDRICVIREDRAYWAELLVLDASPGFAQVIVLRAAQPLPELLRVANSAHAKLSGFDFYLDPRTQRWHATRKLDGAHMTGDGHLSQREAENAVLGHASMRG